MKKLLLNSFVAGAALAGMAGCAQIKKPPAQVKAMPAGFRFDQVGRVTPYVGEPWAGRDWSPSNWARKNQTPRNWRIKSNSSARDRITSHAESVAIML